MNAHENINEYIRSQMNICHKNGLDSCYKQVSDLFNTQFEYRSILQAFENTENYPEVFSRCHQVVHFIGQYAYKTNPDVRSLYQNGSSVCWGGFYHGVMEAYFTNNTYSDREQFILDIKNICGSESDYSARRLFAECLHGIGHAMMFVSNHDLLQALRWCDALTDIQSIRTCYGGVFMENSSSSTRTDSGHISNFIKDSDPLFPCNILEEKYLETCYQYQSSHFSQLTNYDLKKTVDLCLTVPTLYQPGCFMIIGSNQVGSTQETQIMAQNCALMPSFESEQECIRGVVSGLTGRYINQPNITKEFCNLVRDDHQKQCWINMGHGISDWSSDTSLTIRFCDMDNIAYTTWCKKGLDTLSSATQ